MNRDELVIATAVILFAAFLLGWFAHWLIHRFRRATGIGLGEIDRMAQALHDAEMARDQAIAELRRREAEMTSQLAQNKAEMSAAMDGLHAARREADELRAYIERTKQGD